MRESCICLAVSPESHVLLTGVQRVAVCITAAFPQSRGVREERSQSRGNRLQK